MLAEGGKTLTSACDMNSTAGGAASLAGSDNPRTWILDLKEHSVLPGYGFQDLFDYGEQIADMPEVFIHKEVIHPEDINAVRGFYHRVYEKGLGGSLKVRWRNPRDQRWTWGRTVYVPVRDESGVANRAIGLAMSEEEETRIGLQYRQELLRLQSNPLDMALGFYVDLSKNRIIEVVGSEASWHRLAQMKSYDALYESFCQHLARTTAAGAPWRLRRSLLLQAFAQGNRQLQLDFLGSFSDERRRWMQVEVKLFLEPWTMDVVAFFYVRDVHEQKLMRLMLDTLVDKEYDYITYIDGRTHRYWLHYGRREVVLRPNSSGIYELEVERTLQYVVEEDRAACREHMQLERVMAFLRTAPTYSFSYSVQEPDGRQRRKRLAFLYVDEAENQLMLVRTDVTESYLEQKRQEGTLKKALAQAKKAGQARQQFLSSMSHEMRTPLNGIKGMLEILDENKVFHGNPYLARALISTRHLIGLVNDVLDMARIESGRIQLNYTCLPVRAIKPYLEAIIRPLAEAQQLVLRAEGFSQKDWQIRVDDMRMYQVFINILSNAVKYTKPGGRVTYSLVLVPLEEKRARLQFTVQDTGIGMSPEFLKQVYEPFAMEDESHTDRGTGLGLAITRQLVNLMGGTIRIDSTPGRGTRVCVVLKVSYSEEADGRSDAEKREQPESLVPLSALAGHTALVVEDNEINALIAEHQLQALGMATECVSNGQEAVEHFKASPVGHYDVILMDVMMPVMDGLTAARLIRQLPREDAKRTTIVAMTANAFVDDVHKSLQCGMDYHLSKPFERQQLRLILEKAFTGKGREG